MIYELLFLLIILFAVSYAFNGKDLIAPSVIFSASFCFAASWAVIYAKRWDLNLHRNTFLVILVGVGIFVMVSFMVKSISDMIGKRKINRPKKEFEKIYIQPWKKVLFLGIGIFTVIYTIYFIIKATNSNWQNFSKAINTYRKMTIFNSANNNFSIVFPRLLSYCRYVVNAMGYWFMYVVINNYLAEKKLDILSLLIIGSSAISGMVTGGRGYAIYIILAGVAITVLFINKKNGLNAKIDFKTIVKFMCIFLIIILAFQTTGTLLGKVATSKKSINAMGFFDYLAVYCGAEIKNFDIFLKERATIIRTNNNIWGSQTFISLIKWIGPILNITNTNYSLDLPYRMVNGFNLGNVYTTFYPYVYDFGYKGVVLLTGVMALITQVVYERCKKVELTNIPSLSILMYSYIFNTLVFSFFSNKFYELIVSKQFVYTIILWFFYNIVLCKYRIVKKEKNLV